VRALLFSLCLWLLGAQADAALQFPALTGRVVDEAHVLSAATTASLTESLAEYENGTGNQVVVVTLPSLQGDSIEDYGYQLGRYWGIGQKGKDNGALLIVAPHEHKVRIEVGYGLEGTLTDAACSAIIHNIILPDFRTGHMEQGVVEGTQAILSVLGGKSVPAAAQTPVQQISLGPFIIFLAIFIWCFFFIARHPVIAASLAATQQFGGSRISGGGWGGGFSGGGGGGFGGFSGGGGGFGGGGASGGW